jgi:hypothetical protein
MVIGAMWSMKVKGLLFYDSVIPGNNMPQKNKVMIISKVRLVS